jgi:hypothetical protein
MQMTKIKATLIAAALAAVASSAFAAGETKPMRLAAEDKATISAEPVTADAAPKAKAHKKKHASKHKAKHRAKKKHQQ